MGEEERRAVAAERARKSAMHLESQQQQQQRQQQQHPHAHADAHPQQTTIQSAADLPPTIPLLVPPAPKLPAIPAPANTAPTSWNTRVLGLRMGADALAAAAAGLLVAPIITAIDRGIIENASGVRKLGDSLRASVSEMVRKPTSFFGGRPFGLIFMLYFGTYLTANSIDTLSSTLHSTPFRETTSGTPKFVATSTANLALCLYKDSQFTRLFSTASSAPRAPVPLPTFALFTLRDCLTIFASFNLPPLLAPHISQHLSVQAKKYVEAASVAQFVAPAAVQIVSTPLHLLGLDLYNRRDVRWGERVGRVVRDWGVSCVARMGRIVPAFGVGGVVNMKVRRGLMGGLEGRGL